MKIAFFSNALNHHQIDLCDQLYARCGHDFVFVEIGGMSEERKKMGFIAYDREYKINGNKDSCIAKELALEADVAIMGADSFDYLKLRLNNTQKLTFSYSERWLKKGIKNILSPTLLRQIKLYLLKGRQRPWYMLCASGFLANDLSRFGIFKKRCFKWGYFPKYLDKDRDCTGKTNKILWVGRLIDWKHPLIMLHLAQLLINDNIDFTITMIGDGPEMSTVQSLLKHNVLLHDKISILGNQPNSRVIEEMHRNHIFCMTSDRQEGWGAVLGESMAAGCCPVASSEAGATPFLIRDNVNGLTFRTNDVQDLYSKVKFLITNPENRKQMAQCAKRTIHRHWTASIAADNLIKLSEALISGDETPAFTDEPCELIKL